MEIEFLARFNRDIDKIPSKSIRNEILAIITHVEQAKIITEIPQLKKLKGYKNAYRIRMGDYRIGVFIEKDIVEFARIAHRNKIYQLFP